MNRSKMTFALAVVVAVACIASAQAATITMTLNYAGSYDSAFNPKAGLNALPAPGAGVVSPGVLPSDIHQFDVFMTITGTLPGEDFETAVFDAVLGPGVTPMAGGAYAGDNPLYDPPPNTGACPSGCLSVLSTNQDAGTNSNDLKAITVIANSTNSFQGSRFRHPGEIEAPTGTTDPDNTNLAGPMFLGSIFVNWDGATGGAPPVSFVGLADPSGLNNAWSTRDANNAQILYGPTDMNQGPNSQWTTNVIPEPASISLLGLAIVGVLGLIRRR